jgi:chromate transporter
MNNSAASEPHPLPRNLTQLFIAFTLLALQGFGGVMMVVHRELVEKKRWLSDEEFIEDWSVAQLLPGANIINLALILGNRYFGVRGALTALAGILCAPAGVVILLALLHSRFADNPEVIGALRGMGAVAGGLIAATGLRLLKSMKTHPLPKAACAALGVSCFLMIAIMRWPLAYALLGLGTISCAATFLKLKR